MIKVRLAFALLGLIIALIFGSGTGIVGSFGGVSGVLVFSALGILIGWFAAPDIASFFNRLRNRWGR